MTDVEHEVQGFNVPWPDNRIGLIENWFLACVKTEHGLLEDWFAEFDSAVRKGLSVYCSALVERDVVPDFLKHHLNSKCHKRMCGHCCPYPI